MAITPSRTADRLCILAILYRIDPSIVGNGYLVSTGRSTAENDSVPPKASARNVGARYHGVERLRRFLALPRHAVIANSGQLTSQERSLGRCRRGAETDPNVWSGVRRKRLCRSGGCGPTV